MTERSSRKHHRHRAFYTAAVTGVAAFFLSVFIIPEQSPALGSIAFFIVYLAVTFLQMPRLSARFLKGHAAETDAPVYAIFGVTFIVIAVSVFSLFVAINRGGVANPIHLVIAIAAVILGWFMVHAMAAHHYAYEYYEAPDVNAAVKPKSNAVGGLTFPTGPEPDGISFLYFSYVIGMTAQVADVAVSSIHMQRLVMLHGIFSFFFNTVIIAATVNIVVSLGS